MLQSAVITLREGLEAFLIVAISLAYLKKSGRLSLLPAVYWGVVVSIGVSLVAGLLLMRAANEALKLDPESAVAYNNICCAHIELGAHDQAILACNKALEIAPGFQRAWANLEWAYEEALKQTPTLSAYVNLSVARYWLGKLDKSMEASERVLQLDPNNALAYNNICSVPIVSRTEIARDSCRPNGAIDEWNRPDRVIGWNEFVGRSLNHRIGWFVSIRTNRELLLTPERIVRAARSRGRNSM